MPHPARAQPQRPARRLPADPRLEAPNDHGPPRGPTSEPAASPRLRPVSPVQPRDVGPRAHPGRGTRPTARRCGSTGRRRYSLACCRALARCRLTRAWSASRRAWQDGQSSSYRGTIPGCADAAACRGSGGLGCGSWDGLGCGAAGRAAAGAVPLVLAGKRCRAGISPCRWA